MKKILLISALLISTLSFSIDNDELNLIGIGIGYRFPIKMSIPTLDCAYAKLLISHQNDEDFNPSAFLLDANYGGSIFDTKTEGIEGGPEGKAYINMMIDVKGTYVASLKIVGGGTLELCAGIDYKNYNTIVNFYGTRTINAQDLGGLAGFGIKKNINLFYFGFNATMSLFHRWQSSESSFHFSSESFILKSAVIQVPLGIRIFNKGQIQLTPTYEICSPSNLNSHYDNSQSRKEVGANLEIGHSVTGYLNFKYRDIFDTVHTNGDQYLVIEYVYFFSSSQDKLRKNNMVGMF